MILRKVQIARETFIMKQTHHTTVLHFSNYHHQYGHNIYFDLQGVIKTKTIETTPLIIISIAGNIIQQH
ncbi:MAG TPA: hypothetical protein PK048_00910 [Candidatus Absconditabacterales bacterium]|nr:hypothetical protein [Candidatus Absconditabacterales bacterium]